LQQWFWVW